MLNFFFFFNIENYIDHDRYRYRYAFCAYGEWIHEIGKEKI